MCKVANGAMPRSKKSTEIELHPRYDRSKPLLRELVFVNVSTDDGQSFDTLMTRVPGIGEEINREDRTYRILRVQHEPVGDDGRARLGWHAFIDALLLGEEEMNLPRSEEWPKAKRQPRRRRRKAKKQATPRKQ
jgi:hypothetical protein